MMINVHVLTLLGIIVSSTALNTGAPLSACSSLLPVHPSITPQQTVPPFIVTAVQSGENSINVTISSPAGILFSGFILQARYAYDRNRFVPGVFVTSGKTADFAKAIKCNGIHKSTLTHNNPATKREISTVWHKSDQGNYDIIFRATVAENFDKFWMNIDSEPVKMKYKQKSYGEIIYDGCSITKGCRGLPDHCEEDRSCQVLFTYRESMYGKFVFELHGKLESLEFMAMALSDGDLMGSDSATECYQTKANRVQMRRSWNDGKSNIRTSLEFPSFMFFKIEDGYTTCGWNEPVVMSHFGKTYYLLHEQYFLHLAKGPIRDGRLSYHLSKRFGQPILFFDIGKETDPMPETQPPMPPRIEENTTVLPAEEPYTTQAGKPKRLNCISRYGNPPAKLIWLIEERDITTKSKQTDTADGNKTWQAVSVLDYAFQKDHNGKILKCVALHVAYETFRKEIKLELEVLYKPQILKVSSHPGVKVPVYNSTTLVCEAEGNPPPEYMWLQNMGFLQAMRGLTAKLHVQNITHEDEGQYICEATNVIDGKIHTATSAEISLDVLAICSDPGGISNGNAEPVGQIYGTFIEDSSVKYSCAVQHYLKGNKSISCTENGTWSAPKPTCIRACSDLPAPVGGFVEYSLPPNVIIEPRLPMYLPSNPTARYLPQLVDLAAPIRSKVNMTVPVSEPVSLPPGLHWKETRAVFNCTPRYYELLGSKTRRCQESGEWSGRPPICIPVCGRSDFPRSPLIVNGNATDIGHWPWQAGIARLVQGHFILECGASLLSEKWVVTAAHCMTHRRKTITYDIEMFQIYVGKYHREDSKDDEYLQVRKVKEIHVHWQYNPLIFDADIALLLLDSPVILNPRVQPICLPTEKTSRENLVDGSKGVVTGWGADENGKFPETLRQAVLPVVSSAKCEKDYRKLHHLHRVTENMFCAGYADGSADICVGDSGGPMVLTDYSSNDPKWVLEGIVSWGSAFGCGKKNLYGGFTRVSKFLDWIKEYL